jgi:hypothetical protein
MENEIIQTAFEIARERLDRCEGCTHATRSVDYEPYGERTVERESFSCAASKPSQCQAVDYYFDAAKEEHENKEAEESEAKQKPNFWSDIVTVFAVRNGDAQPLDMSKARAVAAAYHSKSRRNYSSEILSCGIPTYMRKRARRQGKQSKQSEAAAITAEIERLLMLGYAPREVAEMCGAKIDVIYRRASALRNRGALE